jgi:signal peptidase II
MNSRVAVLGASGAVFALDRLTKWMVERSVSNWETITVIPGFFNIVHSKNRGAAFGVLSEASSEVRTFVLIGLSSLVLVFLAAMLWQSSASTSRDSAGMRYGLALTFGGALGNVYDRVTAGMVTDFLDFYVGGYHWHTFNIGDSAITVGTAMILLDMFLHRKRVRTASRDAARSRGDAA